MVPAEIIMTENKQNPDLDRGMDGLTEVLRLQAEALSRISERMAGHPGAAEAAGSAAVPPVADPPRGGVHLPVLAGDPTLGEDSLPVLNSFKRFLDEERRRTRKKMIWGLAVFGVVLAVTLTVIVRAGNDRVRELKNDISLAGDQLRKSRVESEEKIKKVEAVATQVAGQTAAQMRKDITRNILWAHSVISSNMTSELSGRDGDMERLKDRVVELEAENAMLSRQLGDLDQRLKIMEATIEVLPFDGAGSSRTPGVVPGGTPSVPLLINSPKYGRPFQLRMPQD